MGGFGSSRWLLHSKKLTVEDCLILNADTLTRDKILSSDSSSGSLYWRRKNGEKVASISYVLNHFDDEDQSEFFINYVVKRGQDEQEVSDLIFIESTKPYFGGDRWWFLCPLIKNGRICDKRVGRLYLPPNASNFGCRDCYDLTYTTVQKHDKCVDSLRRNPDALRALIEDIDNLDMSELMRVAKAYDW